MYDLIKGKRSKVSALSSFRAGRSGREVQRGVIDECRPGEVLCAMREMRRTRNTAGLGGREGGRK